MLWDVGNHLGEFPEASDRHEGQELGGGALGGQEGLQEVNFNLGSNSASEHARYMVLVSKPMFWGMGNDLEPFSEVLDRPEGQEQVGGAVGGQGGLQEVKSFLTSRLI